MNKNILKSAMAFCAVALLASCSLDEYNPLGSDTSEGLTSFDKWYGMQAKCYEPISMQMYSSSDFMAVTECGTDLWITSKNSDNRKELFYYDGLVPYAGKPWDNVFTQCYSALGNCNTVIENGEKMLKEPENENTEAVKQLYAEARFLRGYYHLMLTTYFGPITLVTHDVEQSIDLSPKRNTLTEIYTSVISDLKYAMDNLNVTPYNNNRARATKKAALGMLCRAYAQAAGQNLTPADGGSYWQKAADLAADFVADTENGGAKYGGYLYKDRSDVWAQANNRNNKEALFEAPGIDADVDQETWNYSSAGKNKIFAFCYWNQSLCSAISKIKSDKQNYLYGRTNEGVIAPSKYLLDLYDPTWDKRWENTFQTAFGSFSMAQPGWIAYNSQKATINKKTATLYGIGKTGTIYPYADCAAETSVSGGNQYTASVWPLGETSGDITKLQKDVKNVYVYDYDTNDKYGINKDENRIFLYLSKKAMDKDARADRVYACVNIDDLFDENGYYWSTNQGNAWADKYGATNPLYQCYPCLNKYQWNYKGVFYGSNLQVKNGDVFVMRSAEVYLIAAEAYQKLGNGGEAAKYINKLRKRAARPGVSEATYTLATATEDDVLNEYARELAGEYQRWAVLQRHGKLNKTYLTGKNNRAAASIHDYDKYRPISQKFLQQIDNADEYGDNGYGTTSKSGLDGYEK